MGRRKGGNTEEGKQKEATLLATPHLTLVAFCSFSRKI